MILSFAQPLKIKVNVKWREGAKVKFVKLQKLSDIRDEKLIKFL